jgi:hypothetical protein
MLMIAWAMAWSSESFGRSRTKERSIFDGIDRKLLHQRHRRITGSEIVDRKADAPALNGVEHLDRAGNVAHHHAFGDLELEQHRGHAARRQRLIDIPQQMLIAELTRREVDRHRDRPQPLALPGHVLRAGFPQHPTADRNDQPGFLGERGELRGRQHAEPGMGPAQ